MEDNDLQKEQCVILLKTAYLGFHITIAPIIHTSKYTR